MDNIKINHIEVFAVRAGMDAFTKEELYSIECLRIKYSNSDKYKIVDKFIDTLILNKNSIIDHIKNELKCDNISVHLWMGRDCITNETNIY